MYGGKSQKGYQGGGNPCWFGNKGQKHSVALCILKITKAGQPLQTNSKVTSSIRLSRSDFTWFGLKRIDGWNGQFSHSLLTKLTF